MHSVGVALNLVVSFCHYCIPPSILCWIFCSEALVISACFVFRLCRRWDTVSVSVIQCCFPVLLSVQIRLLFLWSTSKRLIGKFGFHLHSRKLDVFLDRIHQPVVCSSMPVIQGHLEVSCAEIILFVNFSGTCSQVERKDVCCRKLTTQFSSKLFGTPPSIGSLRLPFRYWSSSDGQWFGINR